MIRGGSEVVDKRCQIPTRLLHYIVDLGAEFALGSFIPVMDVPGALIPQRPTYITGLGPQAQGLGLKLKVRARAPASANRSDRCGIGRGSFDRVSVSELSPCPLLSRHSRWPGCLLARATATA